MFDINTKVQWRTGGRGVFRILKGTVISIVKRGKLPTKSMQDKVPHGEKTSNRDRYICETKDGVFAWANINTTYKQGEKMPKHQPRFAKKAKAKTRKIVKARKAAKAKTRKITKAKKLTKAEKTFITPVKGKEKVKPLDRTEIKAIRSPVKKSGGDKPKTTWYGIVDGKVVGVRKVLCPEGFSKEKPTAPKIDAPPVEAPVEAPVEPPAENTGASPVERQPEEVLPGGASSSALPQAG